MYSFHEQLNVHAPPRRAVPPPYRPAAREHSIFLHAADRYLRRAVSFEIICYLSKSDTYFPFPRLS